MSNIIIILLVFLLFLGLLMVGSMFYMNYLMRKYIGSKHSLLEEITNSGKVPRIWSDKYVKKINRLTSEGKHQGSAEIKLHAHQYYMKKLNRLMAYVKKTNLVEDEETRSVLLKDLSEVKIQWEEMNPDEFNGTQP